jgi:hypothetical protein
LVMLQAILTQSYKKRQSRFCNEISPHEKEEKQAKYSVVIIPKYTFRKLVNSFIVLKVSFIF